MGFLEANNNKCTAHDAFINTFNPHRNLECSFHVPRLKKEIMHFQFLDAIASLALSKYHDCQSLCRNFFELN